MCGKLQIYKAMRPHTNPSQPGLRKWAPCDEVQRQYQGRPPTSHPQISLDLVPAVPEIPVTNSFLCTMLSHPSRTIHSYSG